MAVHSLFYKILFSFFVKKNSEGKRGKWIAKIMEYDVNIKPTKLVKGHGLAKLLANSNCQALGLHVMA